MADRTQLLSTWSQHLEGINQDVSQFYSAIEQAVTSRQVPDVKFERFKMKEGAFFSSSSREYLAIVRDDLRYEICGAPFANGFFVSSRLFAKGKFADSLVGDMANSSAAGAVAGLLTASFLGVGTYYKIDVAKMFQVIVQRSILKVVDSMTQAASLPALPAEDRRPVLQSFFQ